MNLTTTAVFFLILSSFINVISSEQQFVPSYLREQIRQAHTFADLLSVTKLTYANHLLKNNNKALSSNDQHGLQLAQIKRKSEQNGNMKLKAASITFSSQAEPEMNLDADAETKKNLDILSTIRQGKDMCGLQSACISIQNENLDPAVLVFPRCYEVTQCVGSCCESAERCHPTSSEYIERPIIEMLYSGNNLFVINQTRNITIEQHTGCSCQMCTTQRGNAIRCSQKKIIDSDCSCQCANKQDKRECQGPHKIWNDNTCTCNCVKKKCYGRSELDRRTCLCRHRSHHQHYADPDNLGNFQPDTSELQAIRLDHMQYL